MRWFHLAFLASVAYGAASAVACGGSSDNGTGNTPGQDAGKGGDVQSPPADAGNPSPEASADVNETYPALLPPNPPQVISGGGPVMTTPKVVPVFFATDDAATTASIGDFVKKVGQTAYWKAVVTEYGVGPATGTDPINLTTADNPPATIDDSAIQTWLAGKLNSNDPAFPAPDANTVYALFYPPNITITLNGGGPPPGDGGAPEGGAPDGGATDGGGFGGGVQQSCTSFGGYHQSITLDANHANMDVAYAVIPRCTTFGPLTGLDVITGTASHELMEAATDPFPLSNTVNPGFVQVDDAHFYWESFLGGGEIGDMCAQFDSSFTKFTELPYTVQRGWSNMAEKAGQDPCVPTQPNEVYFNAVPIFKDMVTVTFAGQMITVTGAHIPVGMSETVELDLFSTAATSGPWTVSAKDQATLRGQPAQLQFSFDKTTGVNGDKVQMTIQVLSAGRRNRESFIVESTLGTQKNIWIGVVGN